MHGYSCWELQLFLLEFDEETDEKDELDCEENVNEIIWI